MPTPRRSARIPGQASSSLGAACWYAPRMPFGIGIWELLILLLVLLLVFGPKRLPEMGRQLGKGMREFKESVSGTGRRRVADVVDDVARAAACAAAPHAASTTPSATPSPRPSRDMARRFVPRRLAPRRGGDPRRAPRRSSGTGSSSAWSRSSPAFGVAYAFHDDADRLADRPPPGGDAARHARRDRAVHDLDQGELLRGARDLPADPPLAGVGVLRAGRRRGDAAHPLRVRRPRERAVRGGRRSSRTSIVLPKALDVPRRLRHRALRRSRSGRATSSRSSR